MNRESSLLKLLVYITVFGNIIRIPGIKIFGLVLTLFRVLLPIIIVLCILKLKNSYEKRLVNTPGVVLLLTVVIWIAWGVLLLLISPYTNYHSGLKEMESLISGICVLLAVFLLKSNDSFDVICSTLKNCIVVLSTLGIFELITGIHLTTSRFVSTDYDSSSLVSLANTNVHLASGVFYNENDYSAFLAIFALALLYGNNTFKKKIVSMLSLLFVIIVLVINDANICLFSLGVGLLTLLLVRYNVGRLIYILIRKYPWALFLLLWAIILLINRFDVQFENYTLGFGSLSERLKIYGDLLDSIVYTKGFGVGPNGLKSYFDSVYHNSYLVDPHNYWLEILAKYGVVVFALFIISLTSLIFSSYKYQKNLIQVSLAIAMFADFVFACLAPSSFMGNNYQWILISLIVIVCSQRRESEIMTKQITLL